MNERIRELAEQALQLVADEHTDGDESRLNTDSYHVKDLIQEKFAELIVKEYEKLLPEICPWADADKEGPMKGWHVQFVARKHFGVEE
jgi:hypothetical protein